MKTLCALVLALVVSLDASGKAPQKGWELYKSEKLAFELWYPSEWRVEEVESGRTIISPAPYSEWVNSDGRPLYPHPWIIIQDLYKIGCEGVYQPPGYIRKISLTGERKFYHERTICQRGVLFIFGYWESDPRRKKVAESLDKVYESLSGVKY